MAEVSVETLEKLPLLKVEVIKVGPKEITIKLPRQRKPRKCVVLDAEDGFIVQGDDLIMRVYREPLPWAWYNPKGKYFFHLTPGLGARPARVPKEFMDALEKTAYRRGDVVGVLLTENGPTRIIFGGVSTIG